MVKKYKSYMYLGSEIRVSNNTDRDGYYWATAWNSSIVERAKTKTSALNKAKVIIKRNVAKFKKRN